MSITITIALFNSSTQYPFMYDDHAKRHVTIQFNQVEHDFTTNPPLVPTRRSRGIRPCVIEDFGGRKNLEQFWAGY